MNEIWESRCCDPRAVIHGCATRFIAWAKIDNHWRMLGAFWSRGEAERAILGLPEVNHLGMKGVGC